MNWKIFGLAGLSLIALIGATNIAIRVSAVGQNSLQPLPASQSTVAPKRPAPGFANPMVAAQPSQPSDTVPVNRTDADVAVIEAVERVPTVPPTVRQPTALADAGETTIIRVRIAAHPTQLPIAVSTPTTILLLDGTVSEVELIPGQWYAIGLSSDGLTINETLFQNGIKLIAPDNGLILISGRWYRGTVRLVWDGGLLLAINEVNLEQYLYGVVGAEMPANWQPEALKAQAIAARSYALALMDRPPSRDWDIGNDEAYQVYRGVETETDTTITAVDDTRGLVLLRNNQIFLSQYASTDAISQAAHGGIGNSMSQFGAQVMASQGATMPEILARYYPDVNFGLLQ